MTLSRAPFIAAAIGVGAGPSRAQHPEPAPISPVEMTWQAAADLPDSVGLKGMFAGTSEGYVLLAGGTNFPMPQRAGGRKAFHRAIYFRPVRANRVDGWTKAVDELPVGLGEGSSVTTRHGIVWIGGHDGVSPVASVFLVTFEPEKQRVMRVRLPDLPAGVTNAAAASANDCIYVAGGEGSQGGQQTFWRLDVGRAMADPAKARWEVLPAWPGKARTGGILVPVTTPAGESLWWGGGVSAPARSQADYCKDAYVYSVARNEWSTAPVMPRGAVLGAAVAIDNSRFLILGGSDGHDFERMKELGERYRIPNDVLLYDARTDRWTTAGTMPIGTVGSAVVRLGDGWLVAGGEYSPGLRTPRVFHLTVRDRRPPPP
jgi:sialate O-acetylesterase